MDETNVRVNSLKAWILAARPKTLTGAAVPVMIGVASAVALYGWSGIRVVPAAPTMRAGSVLSVPARRDGLRRWPCAVDCSTPQF